MRHALLDWILPPIAQEATPKPVKHWLLLQAQTIFCTFHF